ncbi:MAG: hypothetical protein JRD05_00630 [Deltaproteobacteria bacterium]|nr:hypothetical protein [Deltaproteobacteria bacterium]
MNDKQKQCFKVVYDFIHDERSNAQNLIALIDIRFPEIDSDISRALHENVKPYLELRRSLGATTMELMYLLKSLEKEINTGDTKEKRANG